MQQIAQGKDLVNQALGLFFALLVSQAFACDLKGVQLMVGVLSIRTALELFFDLLTPV